MLRSRFNQSVLCVHSFLRVSEKRLQSKKMFIVGAQAAPQQGWDLSDLACRCSHADCHQSSRSWGTAVLKAGGQWCHIWAALQLQPGVGRCQNVPWDSTQKQVALAALQFGSLVCPQQLHKWDYRRPCLFPVVSADGNSIWELPYPFLSPLKLSVSTPPVLMNCRISLLLG